MVTAYVMVLVLVYEHPTPWVLGDDGDAIGAAMVDMPMPGEKRLGGALRTPRWGAL